MSHPSKIPETPETPKAHYRVFQVADHKTPLLNALKNLEKYMTAKLHTLEQLRQIEKDVPNLENLVNNFLQSQSGQESEEIEDKAKEIKTWLKNYRLEMAKSSKRPPPPPAQSILKKDAERMHNLGPPDRPITRGMKRTAVTKANVRSGGSPNDHDQAGSSSVAGEKAIDPSPRRTKKVRFSAV